MIHNIKLKIHQDNANKSETEEISRNVKEGTELSV